MARRTRISVARNSAVSDASTPDSRSAAAFTVGQARSRRDAAAEAAVALAVALARSRWTLSLAVDATEPVRPTVAQTMTIPHKSVATVGCHSCSASCRCAGVSSEAGWPAAAMRTLQPPCDGWQQA